ncbi:MAG TPA: hypothetical protein VI636_16860 [Candidatus Angelobacter sp.]
MAQFQDVEYRQDSHDPATFFYTPGQPSPEFTPAGIPAASLVSAGNGGFFSLGVHWDLAQSQLQALQQYLRRQFPDLATAPVLRPEQVSVDAVKLVLQMPDRSNSVLATTTSAGYPPFSAIFNVALDAARLAQVTMPLSGRENVLTVQYEISGQSAVSCTATISGDVRPDVQQLDPGSDVDACRSQIESAITDGRIQLTVSGDGVSAELRDSTIASAKDQAAKTLQRMLPGENADLDAAHLLVSATLNDVRPVKLLRQADVGRWFGGGNSVQPLVAAAPGAAPGGPINSTFKLGFDISNLPVAFVQISTGDAKQALQPPMFNPVTLRVDPSLPVTVTTNYTDGGQAYQAKVGAGSDNLLTPGQLGFCLISVDGSARKQSGMKQLKMQVKYLPDGNGTQDEHAIHWAFGDWTDNWYFVSRDSGLGGVIEYSWQETASDGTVVDHPPLKTNQTQLKL